VWLLSMEMAVQMAFFPLAMRSNFSIEEVHVFLNSKNLDREIAAFFPAYLEELGQRMASSFREAQQGLPLSQGLRRQAQDAAQRMAVAADRIHVEWDDSPTFSGLRGGICLADSLASHVQAELRNRNRRPGMFYELARVGIVRDYLKDITGDICTVNVNDFKAWEAETGVKIPGLRRLML